jgi:hypothetical protein
MQRSEKIDDFIKQSDLLFYWISIIKPFHSSAHLQVSWLERFYEQLS